MTQTKKKLSKLHLEQLKSRDEFFERLRRESSSTDDWEYKLTRLITFSPSLNLRQQHNLALATVGMDERERALRSKM